MATQMFCKGTYKMQNNAFTHLKKLKHDSHAQTKDIREICQKLETLPIVY